MVIFILVAESMFMCSVSCYIHMFCTSVHLLGGFFFFSFRAQSKTESQDNCGVHGPALLGRQTSAL